MNIISIWGEPVYTLVECWALWASGSPPAVIIRYLPGIIVWCGLVYVPYTWIEDLIKVNFMCVSAKSMFLFESFHITVLLYSARTIHSTMPHKQACWIIDVGLHGNMPIPGVKRSYIGCEGTYPDTAMPVTPIKAESAWCSWFNVLIKYYKVPLSLLLYIPCFVFLYSYILNYTATRLHSIVVPV